jgi:hypothetical protein
VGSGPMINTMGKVNSIIKLEHILDNFQITFITVMVKWLQIMETVIRENT